MSGTPPAPRLVLWAAAATGVQVGAAIVVSRYVVQESGPFTLALLRYAIGALCLAPLVPAAWASARDSFRPRDALPTAALGIGQFGVLIALMNWGLLRIGAAQAALIFSIFPLLTLLLSALIGEERITPRLLAGVSLSIAGVALVLWPKLVAGGAHDWWGELAVAASALVGALCSVLYRPWLKRYPTVLVSSWAMLASVVFLAFLAWPEAWWVRVTALSARAWTAVIFVGLSSGVGYLLWLYALKHESPTRVTVFLALNPVTAALLGVLWLGETPGWSLAASLVLVGAGLWTATRAPAAARATGA